MRKKIISATLAVLLSLCMIFSATGCGGGERMNKIRERGELRVGIKSDVQKFGFYNMESKEFEGVELDIAREICKALLGDASAIKFATVTSDSRKSRLNNETLDLVIATFTITDERKEAFEFSRPYYVDELGFLVRDGSRIESIADMDGKIIGAIESSTAFLAVSVGGEIYKKADFLEVKGYRNYPNIKAALIAGDIDIFVGDKSILLGYDDENTILLDEGYIPQPYGIAAKKGETALAKFVDNHLGKMEQDGTLAELYEKHGLYYDDFIAKRELL